MGSIRVCIAMLIDSSTRWKCVQNVNQNATTFFVEIDENLLVTCVFRSLSFRADTYRKQLKAHYKSRCRDEE